MEVILNKDVADIGKAGQIVKVKEGFARNFLFPQNLAKPVTSGSLKILEQQKQIKFEQSLKQKEQALELKRRLDSFSLTIAALAQDEEKLYGSISAQDVFEALKNEGFLINKNNINLIDPIKSLGIYEIQVDLHPEVTAKLKLWVVKK
ncbi:MAG: 50S ribosomal protein L9 [Candidatus Omnitrophica bacterium CG11_big_fil_rev_8_21_14_0_20_41_12]|nr:MAG: 50S ribosomal protein L9 [Candidatus Omnitrophica bacterium CG11_big_fil_rev_8_21_14_0_20_41_12]